MTKKDREILLAKLEDAKTQIGPYHALRELFDIVEFLVKQN